MSDLPPTTDGDGIDVADAGGDAAPGSPSTPGKDAGAPPAMGLEDAGPGPFDGSTPPMPEAGQPSDDGGAAPDAATPDATASDAGSTPRDAGTDAGGTEPPADAGPGDAGPLPPDASTPGDAGSPARDASAPGTCDGVPAFSASATYNAGNRVQRAGQLYECKPYPYSGWCALDSYEPGTGANWEMAWAALGPCT